ncbi:hypothetical protein GCM10022403_017120 [Streptomyces coacervatus]|uniref:Uncharacterized protein n=1 Tax=Streptomyces coacervatus TaxID=647381 RepID=A0ABP7H3D4_9ACTN
MVVDPAASPALDVPTIGAANSSGGMAATEHLLSLGHRGITPSGAGHGAGGAVQRRTTLDAVSYFSASLIAKYAGFGRSCSSQGSAAP